MLVKMRRLDFFPALSVLAAASLPRRLVQVYPVIFQPSRRKAAPTARTTPAIPSANCRSGFMPRFPFYLASHSKLKETDSGKLLFLKKSAPRNVVAVEA